MFSSTRLGADDGVDALREFGAGVEGGQNANLMGSEELIQIVQDYAADTDTWQPLVRFTAEKRWWTQLHGDDAHDVWLLSWMQDQATELHDHGNSRAAFTVVQGALEEVRFARGRLPATVLTVGEIQTVDLHVVHDVRNVQALPAISIHAYSPPLESMTYYRQVNHALEAVRTVVGREPESSS